jgi:hypothetical protein
MNLDATGGYIDAIVGVVLVAMGLYGLAQVRMCLLDLGLAGCLHLGQPAATGFSLSFPPALRIHRRVGCASPSRRRDENFYLQGTSRTGTNKGNPRLAPTAISQRPSHAIAQMPGMRQHPVM